MKDSSMQNGNNSAQQDLLIEKNKQELLAAASCTTEKLSTLNISIENLPQKCQDILQTIASTPKTLDYSDTVTGIALNFQNTKDNMEKMSDEYQILKIKQKNEELQAKIDRNNKFLDNLRKELECSKESLMKRNPNPDNVQDYIRQLKQKVASYEESFDKAKTKYAKLQVSDHIAPKYLHTLAATLAQLKQEALELQARAEDIKLARNARKTLHMLRR